MSEPLLVEVLALLTVTAVGAAPLAHAEIPVQRLELATVQTAAPGAVTIREVLPREIEGVATAAVSIVGPAQHVEPASTTHEVVWLFLGGKATLKARDEAYEIEDETIARAPLGWSWRIQVAPGQALHAVRVRRQLTTDDLAELRKFPTHNSGAYVRKFRECATYGEAIKSAKTTSRTLLPENYVPRMAVGTVETEGPDRVAPHRHPMLEQLFLGLKDNQITVVADDAKATLTPFSILHIPLGSNHGAEVGKGQKLHYVWIDFFTTREGQDWLKTHKPVASDKEPPPKPGPHKKP